MSVVQGRCATPAPPLVTAQSSYLLLPITPSPSVGHRPSPTARPRPVSVPGAEALALSSLKPKLDAQTPPVRLVAIAGETLGHEEFLRDYWYSLSRHTGCLAMRCRLQYRRCCRKGELFIDPGKQSVFPVVNPTSPSLLGGFCSFLCGGVVKQHLKRVQAKNIQGNLKGEGLKLGGTLVVDAKHGVLFEHQERIWGDNSSVEKMAELESAVAKVGASA